MLTDVLWTINKILEIMDSLTVWKSRFGKINYIIVNTDNDNWYNYIDLDSDADGVSDVTEAGFTDSNNDGLLGNNPVTVDSSWRRSWQNRTDGYTTLTITLLLCTHSYYRLTKRQDVIKR
jgi:hypothetical protein